uniref:TF-B3 domain-containing protein n=1 Tax=Kalanchoe fedtschenkoi TaxID=63787 RepID=A0A7N0VGR1_KALFE
MELGSDAESRSEGWQEEEGAKQLEVLETGQVDEQVSRRGYEDTLGSREKMRQMQDSHRSTRNQIYADIAKNIPMQFIRENSLSYLTDEKMVLRTETRSSWSVNIVANTGGYKLCGGWSAFLIDNGINKGDICEFKLMSRLEMWVQVTPNRPR